MKTYGVWAWCCFLGVLLLSVFLLNNMEGVAVASDNATQLTPVVITATRAPIKLSQVTSSIVIINRQQIENSGATTIGDLLAEQAIGHIQEYPGVLTAVGIRGLRSDSMGRILQSKVLVLLDGRPAGTCNLAEISTRNVERIEIIRGPASVQYGSSAMGGIINIITRRGRKKPTVFLEGKLGSFDYEEGTAGAYGKLFKKFDFSAAYTSESQDDYNTAKNEKYLNTACNGKNYFSTNLGFEFLPHNYIRLIYYDFYADKIGNPSYFDKPNLTSYSNKKFWTGDLIYNGSTGHFSWTGRYYWGRRYNYYNSPYYSSTDQKGFQTQVSFNIPMVLLTTGIDYIHYNLKQSSAPYKSKYSNPSYFLLATGKLLDNKLILSGGFRWDKYRVKIQNAPSTYSRKTKYNTCFRAGVAVLPLEGLKVRFNYGQAFLMPTAEELSANFTASWGTRYLGNPSLDPEKSQTYECGIDFNNNLISSSSTYFVTDFKNKIETVYTSTGAKTWENRGKASIQGFETELKLHIANPLGISMKLQPYLNLVYLTQYKDRETDSALLYTPKETLSYGLLLLGYQGLDANINFAYTGKQKVQDWPVSYFNPPVVEKGDFTVVNLTLTKQIVKSDRFGNLYLRGEVKNVFNKYYSYVLGFPMPGRSLYVGLKWQW